jgi:hypothetical protein
MGAPKPSPPLERCAALDADAWLEVRKRRPSGVSRLAAAEADGLERRLAALVNRAYGLTPEEVTLLWDTAPPRMPGGGPRSSAAGL